MKNLFFLLALCGIISSCQTDSNKMEDLKLIAIGQDDEFVFKLGTKIYRIDKENGQKLNRMLNTKENNEERLKRTENGVDEKEKIVFSNEKIIINNGELEKIITPEPLDTFRHEHYKWHISLDVLVGTYQDYNLYNLTQSTNDPPQIGIALNQNQKDFIQNTSLDSFYIQWLQTDKTYSDLIMQKRDWPQQYWDFNSHHGSPITRSTSISHNGGIYFIPSNISYLHFHSINN